MPLLSGPNYGTEQSQTSEISANYSMYVVPFIAFDAMPHFMYALWITNIFPFEHNFITPLCIYSRTGIIPYLCHFKQLLRQEPSNKYRRTSRVCYLIYLITLPHLREFPGWKIATHLKKKRKTRVSFEFR